MGRKRFYVRDQLQSMSTQKKGESSSSDYSRSSSASSISSSEDVRSPPQKKYESSSSASSPRTADQSDSSKSSTKKSNRDKPSSEEERSTSQSESDSDDNTPKKQDPDSPPKDDNNNIKVGSIRGIPLDLSLVKKMQEADAKAEKPNIPNTLSRESSSASSVSSAKTVTPKGVIVEDKTPPPSPPVVKKRTMSSSNSGDSIISTKSSRSSRPRQRSPSRSSSNSSRSPPRKNAKTPRSSSPSYSRSRSHSRSSYSHNKQAKKGHSLTESDDDSESVSTSSYSYSSTSVFPAETSSTTKKDRYPVLREWFSELPEPQDLMTLEVSDPYLNSVHASIGSLHHYIRSTVQHQEEQLMDQYVYELSKFDGSPNRKEDERRLKFLRDLEKIRSTRRQFRGMLFDAMRERNKAIESKVVQEKSDRELARKIEELKPFNVVDTFTTLFFFFQVIIVLFFVVFIDFSPASDEVILQNASNYYQLYSGIAFMLFVGFAFIGNALNKNVYSVLSCVFMVGVLSVQWGMLWNYWWQTVDQGSLVKLQLAIPDHINALYTAVTCAISVAVVIGRASPLQVVVMVFFECFFYALNAFINISKLKAVDVGGSIMIHTFGAFFGIGASSALFRNSASNVVDILDKSPSYRLDIVSLFGTLFLWVLFPSFNAALVPRNQLPQAIANTVLAMTASTTIASSVSHLRGAEKNKFKVEDIRSATLAGGIAVAAAANLIISPWAAILIGMLSGLIAVLCNWSFIPHLEQRFSLKESRSVVTLHAVTGLIGGLISVLSTGGASVEAVPSWELHFYENQLSSFIPRGAIQPGIQLAAIFITLGIAYVSGLLAGVFMWLLKDKKQHHSYVDSNIFEVPEDY